MTAMLRYILIACLLSLPTKAICESSFNFDLPSLVKASDRIFYGKVYHLSFRSPLSMRGARIFGVVATEDECFKRVVGRFPQAPGAIMFIYLSGDGISKFKRGSKYFFFLKESGVAPYPITMNQGYFEIVNGRVVGDIRDYPLGIPVADFGAAVRDISNGSGCD